MNQVDVIVPVRNEAENIKELVLRISSSLKKAKQKFSIIIIDDYSTDNTAETIQNLSKKYPIKYLLKDGRMGKGYSIIQGVANSSAEYVVMIDGDLQYAPEYIPQMIKLAENNKHGVLIAHRKKHNEGQLRKFISKAGHFIYAKLILGLDFDTQSGLKLFRREIAAYLATSDISPWAFDLSLLHTARELGYSIGSVDIDFQSRKRGVSKINFIKTTWDILTTAIKIRLGSPKIFHFTPDHGSNMIGAGVVHKGSRFITHTTLHHSKSAIVTFTQTQKTVVLSLLTLTAFGLFINPHSTLIILLAVLSAVYFADVFFGLYLVLNSLNKPPELKFGPERLKRIKDKYLPIYTILSPLYKEAEILPQFVKNINLLDWPKEKLDVILILEEDDTETIEAAKKMKLPDYFRTLIVPHGFPKTKPKACNYGLSRARGEFVVIYDAEDIPDKDQLKKAFLGFQNVNQNVFCLQAKLNYYNPNQNLLTKLFTAEYSLWFDLVLPGLQALETTIPLGGTSNHFRTSELKKLEGWDPFNVAEDADLGARLFKNGYKTAIIDSVTLEEANSNLKNWIRQRSRWIKGYLQTFLVQNRHPLGFAKEHGRHYFIFLLVSGLRVSFMVINPFLWAMTAAYFLLFRFVGPQIESLFPPLVFYIAGFSAVFGNFLYLYYYMLGAAKRGEWGLIKYIFLVPFYWLLASIGAFMAFYQLIFKPHFWEKTVHGLGKLERKQRLNLIKFEFVFIKNLGVPFAKIKNSIRTDYLSGAFLVASSMAANILNFLYNAYLGRKLDLSDFGLISLVGSFVYITSIPLTSLSKTISYKSGFLLGKYGTYIKSYWFDVRRKSVRFSLIVAILWLILTPWLANVFKSHTIVPFLIFVPVWIVGFAASVDRGFLTGSHLFIQVGIASFVEALAKLLFSIFFIETGLHEAVYVSIPLSVLTSFLISWGYIKNLKADRAEFNAKEESKFPNKFFISSVINRVSGIAFLSLDLIVAKIFLSPENAGRYAILSLAGKMVYMIGSLFMGFITPLVSKEEGSGKSSNSLFLKLIAIIGGSSFLAFLIFGVFGYITAPILFGSNTSTVIKYLPMYTFAILMQTVATAIVYYYQARQKYIFSYLGFLFSLAQIAGMSIIHRGINDIVWAVTLGGVIYLAAMILLHFYYGKVEIFFSNVKDLLDIFSKKQPVTEENPAGLPRILIFNWRDTKHVWSGGAEVYIHEISKRLVKKGYRVTIFCGNDGKNPRNEKVDGVQIIRRGGFYTVYLWAFLYYTFRLHKYFDIIIDSENGIPFFTPLYAKKKIFLLIHHVRQDMFRIKLKPPLSWIGKYLEKQIMPIAYKNVEVITVSPSSKADILEQKLSTKEPYVIYNGVDTEIYKPGKKSDVPLILYLGRLSRQKSLYVFIQTAKNILEKIPEVEFVIAGDGDDRRRLQRYTKFMNLEEKICFTGKVSESEKVELYQKAWLFVNPSLMEGWGITTIEANACGTPVVASNVSGLRDAVKNPHSGILVPYGDVEEFSKNIIKLIRKDKQRISMNRDSVVWAKKFSWDKSADEFSQIL